MRPQVINVMVSAALKASKGLLRDFGEISSLQHSPKKLLFIAHAERRTEEILHDELYGNYPQYNFLIEGKEPLNYGGQDAPLWIIDPLDGTTNFSRGLPNFAISIALKDGPYLKAGVVYDPLQNEVFWASRGGGTFLDQARLRVSECAQVGRSMMAFRVPTLGRGRKEYEAFQTIGPLVSGLRSSGSTALDLAYVAAGRYDGVWEYASRPWDIAAGLLLIKEAGGRISDHQGQQDILKTGNVVAGNEPMYTFLLKALSEGQKKT